MRSDLLNDLLREVSRSFYLTMRILPARIRPQIGLAYLLARATDTIADTAVIPLESRLAALQQFRDKILGTSSAELQFGTLAQNQSSPAERTLLERAEDCVELLREFSEQDQALIRQVLRVITSGQELDLTRFAGASAQRIIALQSDGEMDDYTFRVAGCVGEFWTKLCHARLFPKRNVEELLPNSISFGKGLQLVNILRDLPRDLRDGRCYIPEPRLAELGLTPIDLLSPATEPRFRRLYDEYLNLAESHLQAGWKYTNALPATQMRLRLACAWPILIGIRTLNKLRAEPVLDPQKRVKISRREVRQIMMRSVVTYPFPRAWQRQFCRGNLARV
jgi:farnesyl-diphosphate farnesyltransferase